MRKAPFRIILAPHAYACFFWEVPAPCADAFKTLRQSFAALLYVLRHLIIHSVLLSLVPRPPPVCRSPSLSLRHGAYSASGCYYLRRPHTSCFMPLRRRIFFSGELFRGCIFYFISRRIMYYYAILMCDLTLTIRGLCHFLYIRPPCSAMRRYSARTAFCERIVLVLCVL